MLCRRTSKWHIEGDHLCLQYLNLNKRVFSQCFLIHIILVSNVTFEAGGKRNYTDIMTASKSEPDSRIEETKEGQSQVSDDIARLTALIRLPSGQNVMGRVERYVACVKPAPV